MFGGGEHERDSLQATKRDRRRRKGGKRRKSKGEGGGGDSEEEGEWEKREYSQALDTLTYHYPPLELKDSSQEG